MVKEVFSFFEGSSENLEIEELLTFFGQYRSDSCLLVVN